MQGRPNNVFRAHAGAPLPAPPPTPWDCTAVCFFCTRNSDRFLHSRRMSKCNRSDVVFCFRSAHSSTRPRHLRAKCASTLGKCQPHRRRNRVRLAFALAPYLVSRSIFTYSQPVQYESSGSEADCDERSRRSRGAQQCRAREGQN